MKENASEEIEYRKIKNCRFSYQGNENKRYMTRLLRGEAARSPHFFGEFQTPFELVISVTSFKP